MIVGGTLPALIYRAMAAILVVFVLSFCLSSAAPSVAAEHGCQGSEASLRICGQSGTSHLLPIVVQQVLSRDQASAPVARVCEPPLPLAAAREHAHPFTPRAPPFCLA